MGWFLVVKWGRQRGEIDSFRLDCVRVRVRVRVRVIPRISRREEMDLGSWWV